MCGRVPTAGDVRAISLDFAPLPRAPSGERTRPPANGCWTTRPSCPPGSPAHRAGRPGRVVALAARMALDAHGGLHPRWAGLGLRIGRQVAGGAAVQPPPGWVSRSRGRDPDLRIAMLSVDAARITDATDGARASVLALAANARGDVGEHHLEVVLDARRQPGAPLPEGEVTLSRRAGGERDATVLLRRIPSGSS